jgi:hypothetical protein
LREREAKQLQKEIDATKARRKQKEIDTIESTSISYDPSSNSSRRSTSVDKVSEGERSGVDDRFTVVKQPSALRLRDKSRAGRRRSSDIVTESERSSVTLHLRDKSLGRRRSSDIITESERGSVALRLRDKSRAGRRRSSDIVTESERGSVDLRLRDKTRGPTTI